MSNCNANSNPEAIFFHFFVSKSTHQSVFLVFSNYFTLIFLRSFSSQFSDNCLRNRFCFRNTCPAYRLLTYFCYSLAHDSLSCFQEVVLVKMKRWISLLECISALSSFFSERDFFFINVGGNRTIEASSP